MGRPEEALEIYRQAMAEAVRANRLDSKLFALLGSASAYCELGDLERAAEALAEARGLMKGTVPPGSPPVLAADTMQGRLALLRGELDEAERLFASMLAQFEARKVSGGSVVMLHIWRSEVALRQHRLEDAIGQRAARARHGAQASGRHSVVQPHRPGAAGARECLEPGRPHEGCACGARFSARPLAPRARRGASDDAARARIAEPQHNVLRGRAVVPKEPAHGRTFDRPT